MFAADVRREGKSSLSKPSYGTTMSSNSGASREMSMMKLCAYLEMSNNCCEYTIHRIAL